MPDSIAYAVYFLFGLVFGSFANVLILRIPAEKSIVPRSQCPQCSAAIAWYDNIPIFSWLSLRGRCRNCGARISVRYPLIEFLCGLLFVFVYACFGLSGSLGLTYFGYEFLLFVYMAYVASIIDIEHMILPDALTLGGCVLGLLGAWINPERTFLDALLGFLVGGGFLYFIAYMGFLIYKKEVMGGGDIKLLAWIGAVFGLHSILPTIFIAGLVPVPIMLALFVLRRKRWRDTIPFGPFLVVGAIATVFVNHLTIVQWLFPLAFNVDGNP